MDSKIEKLLTQIEETCQGEFYAVGGCVRDELLGRKIKDIDILVRNLNVDYLVQTLKYFGKVDQVGASFGVIKFIPRDKTMMEIDFALPRKEISTGSGHSDFIVDFDSFISVEDDLSRRDFTINAIARRISTGEFIDPFGGIKDLENGVIRFVSNKSAKEDPLRILRGIRFVARLGFITDESTEFQMSMASHLLKTISVERIQEELVKIVVGVNGGHALLLALDVHILDDILPEIGGGNIYQMMNTASFDPEVKLAALFSHSASNIVKRLKFSNKSARRISILASEGRTSVANRVGARLKLAALRKAPGALRDNVIAVAAILADRDMAYLILNELRKNPPLGVEDLALDGNDLIELGFEGKKIGELLDRMVRMVIAIPENNTVESLREMALSSRVSV